jgi:hypothetical protein
VLSRDGRLLAHRVGRSRVAVRQIGGGAVPRLTVARSKVHDRLDVSLGEASLTVRAGRRQHVVTWEGGKLSIRSTGQPSEPDHAWTRRSFMRPNAAVIYDAERFMGSYSSDHLTALVDALGQVTVLDAAGATVAIFFAFRAYLAGWMPDGTRFGPPSLIGGPPTPGALERFGQALWAASRRSGSLVR